MGSGAENGWEELAVRRMVRLFSAVAKLPAPPGGRGRLLLGALANSLSADGWSYCAEKKETQRDTNPVPCALDAFSLVWRGYGMVWSAIRRTPFTEDEACFAGVVLDASPWLAKVSEDEPNTTSPTFPPRLVQIQHHLLAGASRKEIAETLGISVNTVAGYIRALYRAHGLRSHVELIRCLNDPVAGQPGEPMTTSPPEARAECG